jgi:hypothetical protein
MRTSCALTVLFLFASFASTVRADIPAPGDRHYWWQFWRQEHKSAMQQAHEAEMARAARTRSLIVAVDDDIKDMRLEMPRELLKQLQTAALAPQEQRSPPAAQQNTMVAGVFLALSLSCGGLWLVRRRGSLRLPSLLLAAVSLLAIGTSLAWADIPPFGGRNPFYEKNRFFPDPTPQNLPPAPKDRIFVEVVEEGDVKLVVNRAQLAKLLEQSAPKSQP